MCKKKKKNQVKILETTVQCAKYYKNSLASLNSRMSLSKERVGELEENSAK